MVRSDFSEFASLNCLCLVSSSSSFDLETKTTTNRHNVVNKNVTVGLSSKHLFPLLFMIKATKAVVVPQIFGGSFVLAPLISPSL